MMRKIFLFIAICSNLFNLLGQINQVDSFAIFRANKYLQHKLGKKIFEKCIEQKEIYYDYNILVTYYLKYSEDGNKQNMLVVVLNSKGTHIKRSKSKIIGKKVKNSIMCNKKYNFRINKEEALVIANNNMNVKGIKPDRIELIFEKGNYNDIRWKIRREESEIHTEDYTSITGNSIIIETLNGAFYKTYWHLMACKMGKL